jgi:TonB family protein
MSITRATPLVLSLLCAVGCGSAKPAQGPDTSAKLATSTTTSADKSSDTDTDGPEDAAPDAPKEKKETDEAKAPPGGGPPPPQAAMVEKPLSGSLSQDDIRNIMMKNGELFNECYTLGADKKQQLVGMVKVQATIGPSGSVTDVKVLKSTVKKPKVDTCVADAFRKIKFPAPANGATSVITFPIEFEGVEMVKK